MLRGVLLRDDQEDGAFLRGEGLRVDGTVKAEHLLHLCVQEHIEPGEGRGDDGGHGLFRSPHRRGGQPFGLMAFREHVH